MASGLALVNRKNPWVIGSLHIMSSWAFVFISNREYMVDGEGDCDQGRGGSRYYHDAVH